MTTAPPVAAPEPASARWAGVGLLLLVALFHGPTLANGFVYDDAWTLVDNPVVRDPGHLADLLGPNLGRAGVPDAGRPVLLATEILDHALWGDRPAGHHLQNLLWHAGLVLLLFASLRALQGGLAAPLLVAALVAVHPINVEPVAAVNYREDLLSAFFLVLCLTTVEKARSAAGPLAASGWRGLAFVLAVLGCLSKENAYLAPLLLLLVDLHRPIEPRQRWVDPLLLAVAASLVFLWRWWVIGAPGQVSRTAELPPLTGSRLPDIGRGCLAFFQGAFQFVWPATFSPEYPSRTSEHSGPLLASATLGLLVVVALVFWQRRRTPWFSLGISWAVVAYLPNLGFLPLTNLRADRYFYLASFGFSLAVVSVAMATVARWPGLRGRTFMELPLAAWIGTAAVLGLGMRALRQGRVWRNDLTVFSAATQQAPRSQRAWLGLAAARLRAGQTLPALQASQRALGLGVDFHARQMHGLILLGQGDLEGARQQLERALAEGPPEHHRAQVLNNLGYVEVKLGRIDQALARFARARQIDPHFDRPWLNAARAHLDRGEPDRARALLEQLLTVVPESVDGWKQLGSLEEKAGESPAARAAFTKARTLAPGDEDAARALKRLGP